MTTLTITDDAILRYVQEAISLALGVDEEEVQPNVRLIADLGAESLDFLDMAFRLERTFEIKLPRQNIIDRAAEVFGEDVFADDDGLLTASGLDLVRARLPEVDQSLVIEGLTSTDIATLLTPWTWVRTVAEVLESVPEHCPDCGGEVIVVDEIKFSCQQCKERIYPPSSDELYSRWLEQSHESGQFQ